MAELLIELFSEEIPARMQKAAAEDLRRLVLAGLKDARLEYGDVRSFWTPRRLTLVVDGLPMVQPDMREEKKGPKVGAPEKALEGFLRAAGLDNIDQCEQRETPKGAVWFAVIERKGQAAASVLPAIVETAIGALPWPKSMRFAAQSFRWVRPLHSIAAVFDGARLEGAIALGEGETLSFCNTTKGHRFLGGEAFSFANFADYARQLERAKVVLDPVARREMIENQLTTLAEGEGLSVKNDPALLDEVTNLVEWPKVLIGHIDDAFMAVPDEALSASMRGHQKYFSLLSKDGRLAPRFAVVANMDPEDGGAAIRSGNERVLRARLADAKFFWDQDLSIKLEDRLPKLSKVIFHASLGTVAERVARIETLASRIADYIPDCTAQDASRAAHLCKADLVSEMVGEFPELQGLMGSYYARAQGESETISLAIADHYSPAGPNDACPQAPVSVALALAEKLDTLVGFWLIDEKPTGSKDPFALRRAALGIIRLLLENGIRLPLVTLFKAAQSAYGLANQPADDDFAMDLLDFFADRMKAHYRAQGLRHDVVSAVFGLAREDDLARLSRRVDALTDFLGSEDGANLLTAYRRAANILKAEEKKDRRSYDGAPVSAQALRLDAERSLSDTLMRVETKVSEALKDEHFAQAMTALAELRVPVDQFFEDVTVNADDLDLRANRLALLAKIRMIMGQLADFSAIEG